MRKIHGISAAILSLTLALTLLLSSCGGGGGGGVAPTPEVDDSLPTLSENGVIVSENTFDDTSYVEVTVLEDTSGIETDSGDGLVTEIYEFKSSQSYFSDSVYVALKYNESDFPAGINADDLHAAYYDQESESWFYLDSFSNETEKMVYADTPHFSWFGLFADPDLPSVSVTANYQLYNLTATPADDLVFTAEVEKAESGADISQVVASITFKGGLTLSEQDIAQAFSGNSTNEVDDVVYAEISQQNKYGTVMNDNGDGTYQFSINMDFFIANYLNILSDDVTVTVFVLDTDGNIVESGPVHVKLTTGSSQNYNLYFDTLTPSDNSRVYNGDIFYWYIKSTCTASIGCANPEGYFMIYIDDNYENLTTDSIWTNTDVRLPESGYTYLVNNKSYEITSDLGLEEGETYYWAVKYYYKYHGVEGMSEVRQFTYTNITCENDSHCDDGNSSTIDVCDNPGTTSSSCSHVTPECSSASDCDDSDPLTLDTCVNPGQSNSSCTSTTIACASDSDCTGTNAYCLNGGQSSATCIRCKQDSHCDDDDSLTNDTCDNPSTTSASCSYSCIDGYVENLSGDCVVDASCSAHDHESGSYLFEYAEEQSGGGCPSPYNYPADGSDYGGQPLPSENHPGCCYTYSASSAANCSQHNTTSQGITYTFTGIIQAVCPTGYPYHSDYDPACCFTTEEVTAVCGNGTVESGEQCDDGNTTSGDGCDSSCQTEGGDPGTNEWITIPAGDFVMGCADADSDCNSDESPRHTVTLSEYKIQKYEVTNAQYKACVDAGTCTAPSSSNSYTRTSYYGNATYNNYPVIYVNWTQASAYCAWIGGRLPTEAEWEKAARGAYPSENIYPWGNTSPTCSLVNGNISDYCVGDTSEVGCYPSGASYYGVMDMAGNVWEWVNDWYSLTYYSSSPTTDPTGPTSGTYRDLRGGSWYDGAWYLRVSDRDYYDPALTATNVGFRCAQD